jgi:hypothetical protein
MVVSYRLIMMEEMIVNSAKGINIARVQGKEHRECKCKEWNWVSSTRCLG